MFFATLPIPPTANQLFPTSRSGHRFISPKYREWRELAEKCFKAQHSITEPIKGSLSVTYSYLFPDRRKRDLANFEKGVSDFLVTQKVIEDDSQIDELRLIRLTEGVKGFVCIKIEVMP